MGALLSITVFVVVGKVLVNPVVSKKKPSLSGI